MKKLLAILTILLITSCDGVWEKKPDEYPLTVVSIYKDGNCPGYTRYTILDNDPSKDGWGADAMYIYLIDKEDKFKIGDTVIFSKKMSKVRYVKVDWPTSQMFMGREGCYNCVCDWVDNSIYQSVFVPEYIYEEVMKNKDIWI